ncbi:hypothetical protein ACFL27_28890, partial [candidate division CSSED10-310 bacterium]
QNGKIHLNSFISKISCQDNKIDRIEFNGHEVSVENIIWTAPLTTISRLLDISDRDLHFLSLLCFNFCLNTLPRLEYQWCYYGGDEIFSRITVPSFFSRSTSPPGKSGLCVEVPCKEDAPSWRNPDSLIDPIITDLIRTKTISSRQDIMEVHSEKITNSYPIYTVDYFNKLNQLMEEIRLFENVILAGRCGTFWYNNMDHSIEQGIWIVNEIMNGQKFCQIKPTNREFWAEID